MWFASTQDNFYYINCYCTGAYKQNHLWKNLAAVEVIIDPDTGEIVDIVDFNYFYSYAVGDNRMILSGSERLNYL